MAEFPFPNDAEVVAVVYRASATGRAPWVFSQVRRENYPELLHYCETVMLPALRRNLSRELDEELAVVLDDIPREPPF